MLRLETDIEGKKAHFGYLRDQLTPLGYTIGENWDYYKGSFDNILSREGGETIYLRIPFEVSQGVMDSYETQIRFQTPYVIKHVVNLGLDDDEASLIDASVNQFQKPLDKDGQIENKNKWVHVGEEAVNEVLRYVQ